MRKLSFLVLCSAIAAAAGCSGDSDDVSGFRVTVLDDVQEAVYDDIAGQYKAVVSDGRISLTLLLGLQCDGLAMDGPVPAAGNYSPGQEEGRNIVAEGSFWTDDAGEYRISGGSVSSLPGDGLVSLSGSVEDGNGNSLHFKTVPFEFSHTAAGTVDFSACDASCSDGLCAISMEGETGSVALVLAAPDVPAGDGIPAGEYRMSDNTLTQVSFSGIEGVSGTVGDAVLTVSKSCGAYDIAGVLCVEDGPMFRIRYEGYLFSEAGQTIGSSVCGHWSMETGRWCIPDDQTTEWTISDTYDAEYGVDILGFSDENTLVFSGLFDASFNMIARVSGSSLIVDANPETNPVAYVNTTKGNYRLFLTLFDPDTGYLMIWDDVEFLLSEDGTSLSVVEEVRDFKDSQTGQMKQASYRYMGLIGLDDEGVRVSMFEQWPFAELPVFTREGTGASRSAVPARRSAGKLLQVNGTVSREEVISVTPAF